MRGCRRGPDLAVCRPDHGLVRLAASPWALLLDLLGSAIKHKLRTVMACLPSFTCKVDVLPDEM